MVGSVCVMMLFDGSLIGHCRCGAVVLSSSSSSSLASSCVMSFDFLKKSWSCLLRLGNSLIDCSNLMKSRFRTAYDMDQLGPPSPS